ncbi:phosphorylase [Methylorubrum salsuginis]|uniref:Hopanoid-associated phosphorylase n=1 Tax=Methylorubrum salsuginis TaxID=414703 RepID=A0A1I4ED43_9HYPH|nr:phosphorylase [Methylorubrum salsuginis]SFL02091.1 hopanoid-associated phosphorylase [Methylorubrum salsuginis]
MPAREVAAVLAVAGLAREARIAAGPGVEPVQAGGRPDRLRAFLAARPAETVRAVVSFGIAGGLDPALAPGDVIVAEAVWVAAEAGLERHPASATLVSGLRRRLSGLGSRMIVADLAGVETAVMTPEAKAALRARTGAAAVDMESQVAAAYAAAHGLPFAAIRVVCDPAERALPAFAANALKPNGDPDILAVLAALARREARVGEVVRLARDSGEAFRGLSRARALLGLALGVDA